MRPGIVALLLKGLQVPSILLQAPQCLGIGRLCAEAES